MSPDQSWSRSQDQSRPSSSAAFQNGTSWKHLPQSSSKTLDRQATTYDEDDLRDGYFKGPAKSLDSEVQLQSKPDLVPAASELFDHACST